MLQAARRLRRESHRAHRLARTTAKHASAADMWKRAAAIQHHAKRVADRDRRNWELQRTRDLTHARALDAHAMHRALARMSPADPLVFAGNDAIPNRDGVPAVTRFTGHWKSLHDETRPLPVGATSPRWLAHVPQAAADDDGQALDAPFTGTEVCEAIFAPRRFEPFHPCHRDCVPCRDYAQDLADWRTGRTSVAPTWSPCLHTSVAAGPTASPQRSSAGRTSPVPQLRAPSRPPAPTRSPAY